MATNVLGVSNLFAAVLPGMLARGRGNLAAVASIAGYLGCRKAVRIRASKAAVITLLQSLRLDLRRRHLRDDDLPRVCRYADDHRRGAANGRGLLPPKKRPGGLRSPLNEGGPKSPFRGAYGLRR